MTHCFHKFVCVRRLLDGHRRHSKHRCPGLLLISVLCIFSTGGGSSAANAANAPAKLPIIHIQAKEGYEFPPYQAGLMLGQLSKKYFPDIEQRYDSHLSYLFSRTQFDRLHKQRLPALLKQVTSEDKEEMRGVSSAWDISQHSVPGDGKLSLTEYQVLNLLPDLGFTPDGSGFAAFGKAAVDNQTLVGRNMDWSSTPELRSLQAITVYHHDDGSVINVGFAGLLTTYTGFNDKGLGMALFNAAPKTPYRTPQRTDIAQNKTLNIAAFDLRRALKEHKTADSATRFLSQRHYTSDSNLLVTDKNKATVLEYPAGQNGRTRSWNSPLRHTRSWKAKQQIAVIDCHLLAGLPDNCNEARDIVRWQRLSELAVFNPEQPATPEAISAIMLDTKNQGFRLFNKQTLQSMVYTPAHNSLSLYAAPAAGQKGGPTVTAIRTISYGDLIAPATVNTNAFLQAIKQFSLLWLVILAMAAYLFWLVWSNKQ